MHGSTLLEKPIPIFSGFGCFKISQKVKLSPCFLFLFVLHSWSRFGSLLNCFGILWGSLFVLWAPLPVFCYSFGWLLLAWGVWGLPMGFVAGHWAPRRELFQMSLGFGLTMYLQRSSFKRASRSHAKTGLCGTFEISVLLAWQIIFLLFVGPLGFSVLLKTTFYLHASSLSDCSYCLPNVTLFANTLEITLWLACQLMFEKKVNDLRLCGAFWIS